MQRTKHNSMHSESSKKTRLPQASKASKAQNLFRACAAAMLHHEHHKIQVVPGAQRFRSGILPAASWFCLLHHGIMVSAVDLQVFHQIPIDSIETSVLWLD